MFLQFWIIWAFIGLTFAVWLFWWSIRTRQFENSDRASLIPFDDVTPTDEKSTGSRGRSVFITVAILMIIAVVFTTLMIIMIL